jgi:mono/diheme cytochrome c family protein
MLTASVFSEAKESAMNKNLFLVFALLLGPGFRSSLPAPHQPAYAPQATAGPAAIPAADAAMVNPLKPTAEGLAKAKKIYGWDCAICHGDHGDGKGDLGAKYKLKDWTDAASLQGLSDGELYYIIKNGRGQMPSEADRVKPDDVWNLVLLVRSYPKKQS